jgi:hypothetical protein
MFNLILFLPSDGVAPEVNSPIVPFLTMRMPEYVTVDDPSLEVLNLLRIVHSLNRHWGFLYNLVDYKPILSNPDLINMKLTAKANRQLQVKFEINFFFVFVSTTDSLFHPSCLCRL